MLKFTKSNTNLDRFINAQQNGYGHGCSLADGLQELLVKFTKTKHYSWYAFPQIRNSHTKSEIAKKFALVDANEAIEYIKNNALRNNLTITYRVIIRAVQKKGKLQTTAWPHF